MRIGTFALVLGLALPGASSSQTYNIHNFAGGGLPENIPPRSTSLGMVRGVAADSAGNVYFSLEEYHVVLRLDVNGALTRAAGNGTHGYSGDGATAAAAQLASPLGVAVGSTGDLYIADSSNHRIRKVSGGVITTIAGTGVPGYSGDDGPAELARLSFPNGIAVDSAGALCIVDYGNHRIRKISGGVITTIAGTGSPGYSGDGGPAIGAQLSYPEGVAVDSAGNVYIADANNFRIRKVSGGAIDTVAGNGVQGYSGDNGPAVSAQLTWPDGIAVDAAGSLYIADSNNQRIRKVSGGVITTVAGNGAPGYSGDNAPAATASLNYPAGVAASPAGALYIADSVNFRIRRVLGGIIETVAGSGGADMRGDNGPALLAQLSSPASVAADSSGAVYLAEYNRHRIRRVENGVITTSAGIGTWGYGGDGGPAVGAPLNWPAGIAVDSAGNLYIADSNNNRIRKVSGGSIATVAGDGTFGFGGDGGPATAAQLGTPAGVAVGAQGDLYFADPDNHRIRKVSGGIITTVAGNGIRGYSGDGGPATSAQLRSPTGVAVDPSGNLYIADTQNHRVRRVSNGVITTVAGDGAPGFGGDGGPATSARLSGPRGIAVDADGSLYIADHGNYRVRKMTGGTITTIAGAGTVGYSGDDGPATGAQLGWIDGLAVDWLGKVYLADTLSHRVRVLIPALAAVSAASFAPSAALAPGVIAAGYGSNLASTTEIAPGGGALPAELAGTSVSLRDSAGVERAAPLWFVSPGQINFEIPEATALGQAMLRVVRDSQTVASGTLQLDRVSPGLFSMNANGQGVAAGQAVLVKADGSQVWQALFDVGCTVGSCRSAPVDLGGPAEQLYLEVYGTGLRGRSAPEAVRASIGGVDSPVEYAGPAPDSSGLDQVKLRASRGLAGRGEVELVVTVDGVAANTVLLNFR